MIILTTTTWLIQFIKRLPALNLMRRATKTYLFFHRQVRLLRSGWEIATVQILATWASKSITWSMRLRDALTNFSDASNVTFRHLSSAIWLTTRKHTGKRSVTNVRIVATPSSRPVTATVTTWAAPAWQPTAPRYSALWSLKTRSWHNLVSSRNHHQLISTEQRPLYEIRRYKIIL